jgi:hypothetical protein
MIAGVRGQKMENFTFQPNQLAVAMVYKLATLKRLMTQDPSRLPPAVLLGAEGKKGKRLWLRSTVEAWLKEREMAAGEAAPATLKAVTVPELGRRGPGRPRKMASAPGQRARAGVAE